MNQAQYGIRVKPQFPVRGLLVVPHKSNDLIVNLIVSYPAFGLDWYKKNLEVMSEDYPHPETGERISFRPATTSESISVAAFGFGSNEEYDAKRNIFDPRWLQLSYIVRTHDGVFTNTKITDENELKSLLNRVEKVNGIYLIDDNIAFAPYETFQRGIQDRDAFAQGGLARALEHTPEKVARNLREMASPEHYKRGVNVYNFDDVKEPVLKVAILNSDGIIFGDWLGVSCDNWDDNNNGFAFGVRT